MTVIEQISARAMLSALVVLSMSACTYPGWKQVRIEDAPTSPECVVVAQEGCYKNGAACYEYYKKRATKFEANIVVLRGVSFGDHSSMSGGANRYTGAIVGGQSNQSMVALADYYQCPTTAPRVRQSANPQ